MAPSSLAGGPQRRILRSRGGRHWACRDGARRHAPFGLRRGAPGDHSVRRPVRSTSCDVLRGLSCSLVAYGPNVNPVFGGVYIVEDPICTNPKLPDGGNMLKSRL